MNDRSDRASGSGLPAYLSCPKCGEVWCLKHGTSSSPPSGNAGEGAEKRTAPENCPHGFNEHDCDCVDVCNAIAAPPQPAPHRARALISGDGRAFIVGNSRFDFYEEALKAARTILSFASAQPNAQSSPCLRYVNDDAELVCKCVNGKYPEVVDMEWRPPTCKAAKAQRQT